MLGLAASHLSMSNITDYSSDALSHRVRAIKLLNTALSKPCSSKAEADARFATIMALTFQSSYMPEGMVEFLVMLRGCTVVSDSALLCLEESVFAGFSADTHNERVLSLNPDDVVDVQYVELLRGGLDSIVGMRPICQSILQVRYLILLERILKLGQGSPVSAFTEMCISYSIFGQVGDDEFKYLTDSGNYASQIILIHFFVIEYILATVALRPVIEKFPFRRTIVSAWTRDIARRLPFEYEQYIRWPLEFVNSSRLKQLC
ncbi:hypothetical protein FDECE_4814 [Fusarium decemcellulare]|nr:hypothetical protein FDECE_4814 [Fusarium decemcellulare]